MWLDRGELDKIIERTAPEGVANASPRPPQRDHDANDRRDGEFRDDDDDRYRHGKKKKKGGFLGEIFDFDWNRSGRALRRQPARILRLTRKAPWVASRATQGASRFPVLAVLE